MAKRAIIVVLDGVGIGEMPDAHLFGDEGSDTLGNLSRLFPDGLNLPNLARLGLGNIADIQGVPPVAQALGCWGKCAEMSKAKDTTIGHWEIAGVVSQTAFPTYPQGFPPEVIEAFESQIGVGTLGNCTASGTEIIQRLGDEHVRTRKPIVYTSADSVFQIATHEDVYPPEELYRLCEIARRLLDGEHRVSRVIARPFTGPSGHYERTRNRQDFSVPPPAPTLLDKAKEAGYETVGVGKIGDIFAHQGLTREIHTKNNEEGILLTLMQINEASDGIIFTNLVDFDMLYGHRNDAEGFRRALEAFDLRVPSLLQGLHLDDLLILTADHGCDPTTPSTDHSREYVPLLVYSKRIRQGCDLGIQTSFACIAQSVAQHLGLEMDSASASLLPFIAVPSPSGLG